MGVGPGRYRCEMGHGVRDMRGLTTDAELNGLGLVGMVQQVERL